jgi:hypothetical protein
LWHYSLITDKLTATLQVAKRVYSLAQEQHDSALMMGAYRTLAVTLYFSGDFETAQQNAMRGVQIWRSGGVQFPVEEVSRLLLFACVMERCTSGISEKSHHAKRILQKLSR